MNMLSFGFCEHCCIRKWENGTRQWFYMQTKPLRPTILQHCWKGRRMDGIAPYLCGFADSTHIRNGRAALPLLLPQLILITKGMSRNHATLKPLKQTLWFRTAFEITFAFWTFAQKYAQKLSLICCHTSDGGKNVAKVTSFVDSRGVIAPAVVPTNRI